MKQQLKALALDIITGALGMGIILALVHWGM